MNASVICCPAVLPSVPSKRTISFFLPRIVRSCPVILTPRATLVWATSPGGQRIHPWQQPHHCHCHQPHHCCGCTMGDDEALEPPASTLEELLSIDLLSATLESLPARGERTTRPAQTWHAPGTHLARIRHGPGTNLAPHRSSLCLRTPRHSAHASTTHDAPDSAQLSSRPPPTTCCAVHRPGRRLLRVPAMGRDARSPGCLEAGRAL